MLGTALLRSTVMPEFWTSWYTSGRILGTYLHGVFRARLDGSRFALLCFIDSDMLIFSSFSTVPLLRQS
jgi:hypothetical protein